MIFSHCTFTNSGNSLAASTLSSGLIRILHSNFRSALTTSGTAGIDGITNSSFVLDFINTTCLTVGGSGVSGINETHFNSGTASGISVGSNLTLSNCTISSSNTNAITGSGTITYSVLGFPSSSSTINTTTQTSSGTIQGSKNTAPAAGFLGEQIRSFVPSGSAITLSNSTPANITSINIPAGIWDVSAVIKYVAATSTSATLYQCGISPNSATNDVFGDDFSSDAFNTAMVGYGPTRTIPSYRITLSSTTTYYLVATAAFTISTMTAYGRISATRVG
jgi:hypothetical protein